MRPIPPADAHSTTPMSDHDSYAAMLAAVQAFHEKHDFQSKGGEDLLADIDGDIRRLWLDDDIVLEYFVFRTMKTKVLSVSEVFDIVRLGPFMENAILEFRTGNLNGGQLTTSSAPRLSLVLQFFHAQKL